MKQYLDLVKDVLDNGTYAQNRTGMATLFKHGAMLKFDMADGFPAITTKKLAWKSCFGEMIGFLRGYDSAEQFRYVGCNVWDANANENQAWLKNPSRRWKDDLGRVYGKQARNWLMPHRFGYVDQLRQVYSSLKLAEDDRRLIVTHWNPGELDQMALPPCHLLYQFGLRPLDDQSYLDLCFYIRSWDLGLGAPFNIAGYAWLLHVMARITGHTPGELTVFTWNYHVYEDHIPALQEQLTREPRPLPKLQANNHITQLEDLETWVVPEDFDLVGYDPHPAIRMKMAV